MTRDDTSSRRDASASPQQVPPRHGQPDLYQYPYGLKPSAISHWNRSGRLRACRDSYQHCLLAMRETGAGHISRHCTSHQRPADPLTRRRVKAMADDLSCRAHLDSAIFRIPSLATASGNHQSCAQPAEHGRFNDRHLSDSQQQQPRAAHEEKNESDGPVLGRSGPSPADIPLSSHLNSFHINVENLGWCHGGASLFCFEF